MWDKKRASKLIESLLIGIPVPQVFLYEESRNNFVVIDGQQRLLSLFFFVKERFPLQKIRGELRPGLSSGKIDVGMLRDNDMFTEFRLTLPKTASGAANRFNGLRYGDLGDDGLILNMRTIRNIVVKQMHPEGNSAMYEIFSRLNAGGVNLSPQEIRASLYHSELIESVLALNLQPGWRRLVGRSSPDPRMKDTEFLLRSLALARRLDSFKGSMVGFVNGFCEDAKKFSPGQTAGAIADLRDFLQQFDTVESDVFSRGGKFSGVLFEAFFAGWVRTEKPALLPDRLDAAIRAVKVSSEFAKTLQEGSTKSVNVLSRIALAEDAIEGEKRGNDGR